MTTFLAIGFVTGVASGLLGVGGGFVLIPLLSLVGVPLHLSIGASLVFIFCTSVSGALRHLTQGTADWQLGLPLMLSSSATAVAGSILSVRLTEGALGLAFALATTLALVLFNAGGRRWLPAVGGGGTRPASRWRVAGHRQAGGTTYDYRFHLGGSVAVGALLGLVTGLLGIGGGFLLVPMLTTLLGIPLAIAIGSSLLSIVAAAIAGIVTHWSLIGVEPSLVLPLAAAGVLGAQLGARLVVRLPLTRLRLVYNLLLLGATGYMLARAVNLAAATAASGLVLSSRGWSQH